MNYTLSFGYVWGYRWALLNGLGLTLAFTVAGIAIGLVIGFLASAARQYGPRPVAFVAATYVELFRGTPVLIQLFWFFFCLPALLGVDIDNAVSTIIALSLYMGALSSESFRSALKGIGSEQHDACTALGLSMGTRLRYVILPQALLRAIPTLISNAVVLFKESALVSTVGMADLMYQGQSIADTTARPIEILTVVALIYFVIAFTITRIVAMQEQRLLKRLAM